MEFKGTGGDWYVLGDEYPSIQSKENRPRVVHTFPTIAQVNSTFICKEEYKANAQIIAHAPKLLEMLKKMLQEFNAEHASHYAVELCLEAEDLINQATTINK